MDVAIDRVGGFVDPVTLGVSGLPSGVTPSFEPASTTGATATLRLTSTTQVTPGTYQLMVTATSTLASRFASVTMSVNEPPSFDLITVSAPMSLPPGASTNIDIGITRTGTPPIGAVSFQVVAGGLPAGVTPAFSANPAAGSNTVLTLSLSPTVAVGLYRFTVRATAGAVVRTADFALSVTEAPDFALSATPNPLTIASRSPTQSTLTIHRTGGFAAPVDLEFTAMPPGVTASFGEDPAAGTTSVVTLVVGSGARTGTSNLTIRGSGGGLTRTVSIPVTLTAAATGTFALSLTPSAVRVYPYYGSATTQLGITRFDASTAPITLSATSTAPGLNVSFASNPVTGGPVQVTLSAGYGTATGFFTVTITGTLANGETETVVLTVEVILG
jgi:hypothetical protein